MRSVDAEKQFQSKGGGCIDAEVLAALLDGRLEGEEKARALAHVSRCDDCHELFAGAGQFLSEEGDLPVATAPLAARRRHRALLLVPLAAAATLALILWGPWPQAPQSRPVAATASGLAADPMVHLHFDGGGRSELGWSEEPVVYGFSSVGARERASFLAGVASLDLAVALREGRREQATAALDRVRVRHRSLDQALPLPRELLDIEARLRSGPTPEAPRWPSHEGAEPFDSRWVGFGRWIEAARLAAHARDPRFLEGAALVAAVEEALALPLGDTLREQVLRVRQSFRRLPASEEGWSELERALAQVIRLV